MAAADDPPPPISNAVILGLVLLIFALKLIVEVNAPIKDDVAWLLHVAQDWIDGHRLYGTLIELNPPTIIWFSALPVLIGRALDISPLEVMPVFCGILVMGGAWWTASLLVRRGLFRRHAPVFAAIAVILLFVPTGEFGQREHIIAAAALPYLALRMRPLGGGTIPAWEAAITGALVALCCALKPWYAPAFVLVEIVMVARGGALQRAAILSAVATGAAIATIALLAHPEYFTNVVPMALKFYLPPPEGLGRLFPRDAVLLFAGQVVAVCLWWLRREARDDGDAILILLLFAFGATCAYFEQGRGWFYHRIPAAVATVSALLLCAAMSRPQALRWTRIAAAVVLVAFAGQAVRRFLPRVVMAADLRDGIEERLSDLLQREGARSYLAFSNTLALGFPVVDMAGTAWASRFASMWAVRGELLSIAAADPDVPPSTQARRWVIEDFLAACPDVVVVDTTSETDYPAVLSAADPAFARAWAGYTRIGRFDALLAYRRAPGAAPCESHPAGS